MAVAGDGGTSGGSRAWLHVCPIVLDESAGSLVHSTGDSDWMQSLAAVDCVVPSYLCVACSHGATVTTSRHATPLPQLFVTFCFTLPRRARHARRADKRLC